MASLTKWRTCQTFAVYLANIQMKWQKNLSDGEKGESGMQKKSPKG